MTTSSDAAVSKVNLPNEVRHDVTYNISETIAIGYRNLSHGVGVISIKDRKTGNLVNRKHVGVSILEDGQEIWETAWLHAGQAVMYQVPDGDGRHHHRVLIDGREVLTLQPTASVEISYSDVGCHID